MSNSLSSERAKTREAAKRRRIANRERRGNLLELVSAGHSYETIAAKAGVSVSTLKGQVQRALAQQRPEPAESFVALQRKRLNKALQYTDFAMERGDMRAVAALVALLPHIDRYWGLQNALAAGGSEALGAHVSAPKPMKSLESKTGFPPLEAVSTNPPANGLSPHAWPTSADRCAARAPSSDSA